MFTFPLLAIIIFFGLILSNAALNQHLGDAGIDYAVRGMEKPSDHAPTWIELDLED